MTICEFEGCKTESSFNFKGYPRKFCCKHKEPYMLNVKDFICKFENCEKTAYYNYCGLKEKLYCAHHKLNNMVNVKNKLCEYKECIKQPCFNYKNNKSAKYCFEHKEIFMVDVRHKYCKDEKCINRASYNFLGNKALYCFEHKCDNMVNIERIKCKFENCKKSPIFNFFNETRGIYCYTHKLENMVDVCNKKCMVENCNKVPSFNYDECKQAIYCCKHKLENMINVKIIKCKTNLCQTKANDKYDGFCLRCYIHNYPNKPTFRNYKTKEQTVVDYIKTTFPKLTIMADKVIEDGCSRKRPDIQIDLGYQIIIVEIDENQHKYYDCSCENKRLMEISQDCNHRPIIFIRFNPDGYMQNNVRIQSCWKISKTGIMIINKAKEIEWNDRLNCLKTQIDYWCNPNNVTNKTIEIIELYYDN